MFVDETSNKNAINCIIRNPRDDDRELGPAISDPLRKYLSSSLSEHTLRAYAADLADFKASGRSIPSSPLSIAEYLAELASTRSVATIQRRIAAISKAHNVSGFDDPCRSEVVKAAMRGIRRTKGVAQRAAQALLRDDLFAVLSTIGTQTIDVRDKALLLIGFAGAFRRSELASLNIEDIEHVRQGIIVHLRRSKTDQIGQGRKIAIPNGRTRWCPVTHLNEWIKSGHLNDGPLFHPIDRHGNILSGRISSDAISNIIKRRARDAGFNPEFVSGHSLRSGLATSAAALGVAYSKIRQQTGHKNDAMLSRYIRDGQLFCENAAGAIL